MLHLPPRYFAINCLQLAISDLILKPGALVERAAAADGRGERDLDEEGRGERHDTLDKCGACPTRARAECGSACPFIRART